MADRASEASGALAALARRSDVDPRTLGAWGISQAGWVLPRVRGPQGEPLAFIVGVSLPGGTPDAQDRFRTDSLGFDAREQREANRWARRRVAMMQQAVPWSVFAREQGGLHERPWLRQLGELDEKSFTFASRLVRDHPTLERIDSPTLLFLGGNDKLVDIEDSASAFVRAARRGHVPLTIRVIPDADHGLGVPSGADTGYTRTIRTWLSDLLHRQL
jgi:pimeloyl-ACP methyl ester carboxylesterase